MTALNELAATRACHCLAARRRARAITRWYEERLRPYGLRATQFSILAALAQTGPMPVGELAELLGLERTTLTRSARLMERNGWIGNDGAQDARVHSLRLLPAGRRKLEAAFPAWKEVQNYFDRKLREDKSHGSIRHDLSRNPRSSRIKSGAGSERNAEGAKAKARFDSATLNANDSSLFRTCEIRSVRRE